MQGRPIALTAALIVMTVAIAAQSPPPIRQLGSPVEIGTREKNTPAKPTPRWPDGTVNLGAAPGEFGLWLPFSGVNERLVMPDDLSAEAMKQYPGRPQARNVPFQPWAKGLYDYLRDNQFEPHSPGTPS